MSNPKITSLKFLGRMLAIWAIASLALIVIAVLFPKNLTIEFWYTPVTAPRPKELGFNGFLRRQIAIPI